MNFLRIIYFTEYCLSIRPIKSFRLSFLSTAVGEHPNSAADFSIPKITIICQCGYLIKGVNVFAPQLCLWQVNRFGPDNKRDELDLKLKQLGSSIAALEIYSIKRCLDYFEKELYCSGVFGMAGLSYGGFYTLYTTAADTRIKSALSCSHFNDRIKYGWASISFFNAASTFLDAETAALIMPRHLAIEVGDNDELFTPETAQNDEFEILKGYAKGHGDCFKFHIFKGVHEFCPENDEAIDWFISKL